MMISPQMSQESMHEGLKFGFMVHLLKVSGLPSPVPTIKEEALRKKTEKNLLKVTALYGCRQVAVGEFSIVKNECIIDQCVICLLNLSKSDCHSKLHFYIDEACSSGLTGHMAFDLKEFAYEGDLELHLKYPLYANTSGYSHGPILKMTIKRMDKGAVDAYFDGGNEGLIVQDESADKKRIKSPESGCMLQDSASGHSECVNWRKTLQSQYQDEAQLLKLEGALSKLDEKLKILSSACRDADSFRSSDRAQYPMTLQWRGSLHNEICSNSQSEVCRKLCTDSDDAVDSFADSDSMTYPPSSSKHSRAFSDASWQGPVHGHKRNTSTDEVSSDFLFSQSSSVSGEEDEHRVFSHECVVCSTDSLRSYQQINSGLSRDSKSVSQRASHQRAASMSTGMPPQPEKHFTKRDSEVRKSASRKGPGLLKSIVGAVLFAGVSILGARNANGLKQEASQSSNLPKTGQVDLSDHPADLRRTRSIRRHYSARFSL